MIPLARKFFRRSPADRRLLVRAFGVHACVAVLLRVAGAGRLSRWLTSGGVERTAHGIDDAALEGVVRAVRQAAAIVPWGRTCLTEALTAAVLLRRAGCETNLRYGVAAGGAGVLDAHAWLEYRGAVILGHSARPYAALHHARRSA
jgi:hypothetical protein